MSAPFVDGNYAAALAQASVATQLRTQSQSQEQSFFATPARAGTSTVREVLEVALAEPHLINSISFDAARFPHRVTLEYHDLDTDAWWPLRAPDSVYGLSVSVQRCVPARLPQATAVPGHLHPQHSYLNHWEPVTLAVRPTLVRRVRLVLVRTGATTGPLDAFGHPADYSLAITNLRLDYLIASREAIARTARDQDNFTLSQPFASTTDLLGSAVDYLVRANYATNVLLNTDADAPLVWRCEPQPMSTAVVNFYADLRDGTGHGQVIDRIYLDPINNGAHVSLYYSNDNPVGGFSAVADALVAPDAVLAGEATISAVKYLHLGRTGSVTVRAASIGFDPSLPWWLGLTIMANADLGNPAPILSLGAFTLAFTATGLSLASSTGDIVSVDLLYTAGEPLWLVAAYDGTVLHLHVVGNSDQNGLDVPVSAPVPSLRTGTIVLGTDATGSAYANVDIVNLVLKEEFWVDDDFLAQPYAYSTVTQFAGDQSNLSANAILRADPSNALAGPSGLFGGPVARYETMTWTPVPRDYLMQRGWMNLPTTRAKFWNLEITNLQPQYRDIHLPSAQVVRTFPAPVLAQYAAQSSGRDQSDPIAAGGLATHAQVAGSVSPFTDFARFASTGGTGTGFSNTEAYVAPDYATASRLYQGRGGAFAYQDWHGAMTAPRWNTVSVHDYHREVLRPVIKSAYGTGLRRILFARSRTGGQIDRGSYEDAFIDTGNLASSTWVYDPVHRALTSTAGRDAVATSVPLASLRAVSGVQFASQQSHPVQLLADPDFADPLFGTWNMVGDARRVISRIDARIGTVVVLSRDLTLGYWGDVAPVYPTWQNLIDNGITYGALRNGNHTAQTSGGIESNPVVLASAGGRIYAAARVLAPADLSSPLHLQIVDTVTGLVLAEQARTVSGNQVAEWSVGYTIGSAATITAPATWGDLSGNLPDWPLLSDTFLRPDAPTLGVLTSGQPWLYDTASGSLALVSGTATVTTAGQRSGMDTKTPWGTLTVVLGATVATGTNTDAVPLLDFGTFWVMNDGRIVSTATTPYSTPAQLTAAMLFAPTAADTLAFTFLPTAGLSPAQNPGGIDPNLKPYAMVLTRNGTYLTTVTAGRMFALTKYLMGAPGQAFTSVSWIPSYAETPVGESQPHFPMPLDGTMDPDGQSWTAASDGSVWMITGSWTFSNRALYMGGGPIATAQSTDAAIYHDFGQDYGTLTINVLQVAPGIDPSTYPVAYLDYGVNPLLLRADGSVGRADGTVLRYAMVPNVTAGGIVVRYIRVSQLSAAFCSTYNIPTTNVQALVFIQNDVVLGAMSEVALWDGTVRGIAGYSDNAGHNTIVQGLAWSPDVATNALDTRAVTWLDVSHRRTYTWGDVRRTSTPNTNPVTVRLVQLGASADEWEVDTVSLFLDPIEWEFSNDAGSTWYPAPDIANNPDGVLLFPPVPVGLSTTVVTNQLCWRVRCWGQSATVSNLSIRPWYLGHNHPVSSTSGQMVLGPNVSTADHYPPIHADPRFSGWDSPIPRDWFFAYRDLSPSDISDITSQWDMFTLGDDFVV